MNSLTVAGEKERLAYLHDQLKRIRQELAMVRGEKHNLHKQLVTLDDIEARLETAHDQHSRGIQNVEMSLALSGSGMK